jgi:uncharacterized protein (DUF1697 family)
MAVAVALIRGINVGGKHKLPMATLRALCAEIGWRDVATHIQSGNVVFRCQDRALAKSPGRLESAIEEACGFRPSVVVRSLAEMRGAIGANPFGAHRALDPSKLLVLFLTAPPAPSAGQSLLALKPDPERIELVGREVYLYYPNGVGKAKLPFTAIEKAVKISGTTRNWNTIAKVLAMAEALDGAA